MISLFISKKNDFNIIFNIKIIDMALNIDTAAVINAIINLSEEDIDIIHIYKAFMLGYKKQLPISSTNLLTMMITDKETIEKNNNIENKFDIKILKDIYKFSILMFTNEKLKKNNNNDTYPEIIELIKKGWDEFVNNLTKMRIEDQNNTE